MSDSHNQPDLPVYKHSTEEVDGYMQTLSSSTSTIPKKPTISSNYHLNINNNNIEEEEEEQIPQDFQIELEMNDLTHDQTEDEYKEDPHIHILQKELTFDSRDDSSINISRGEEDSMDSLQKNTSLSSIEEKDSYFIDLNDTQFLSHSNAEYPSNFIKTSKYSIFTFIPLNLFEQFRRIANIYMLMIIAIQLIPGISPFPIYTSAAPLCFILMVGAIKDGIEDYDRHRSDRIANALPVLKLKEDDVNDNASLFIRCSAADLQPSDIILIKRGQEIPADCIVLSSKIKDGTCYISTASLDGENAPKLRRSVRLTANLENPRKLLYLKGQIKCPQNNKNLHGFNGAIFINKQSLPSKNVNDSTHDSSQFISGLSDINMIFRGSKLTNTEYIHAIVLFVGSETKLMLNRNQVPFKFSTFEKLLNRCIFSILIFNFSICLLFGLAANLVMKPFKALDTNDSWFVSFMFDVCSWLILTSWMIPFPLYVSLELVKVVQAKWVAWDEQMVYIENEDMKVMDVDVKNVDHIDIPAISAVHSTSSYESGDDRKKKKFVSDLTPIMGSDRHVNNEMVEQQYTTTPSADDDVVQSNYIDSNRSSLISSKYDGDGGDNDDDDGKVRYAKVKNSNLNEELGHIDYIFTDKTGTLTKNLMEMSKFCDTIVLK